MGVTVESFEDLERLVVYMSDEVFELVEDAVRDAFEETFLEAKRRSSAVWTRRSLRVADHPFAVRHGTPFLPADMIGIQSGEFYAAWYMRVYGPSRSKFGGMIYNDAPHADYLIQGTETMVARPIDKYLENYLENQIMTRVNEALEIFENEY